MRIARSSKEEQEDFTWGYVYSRILIVLTFPAWSMSGPIVQAIHPNVPELALFGVSAALVAVLGTLLWDGIRMVLQERIDANALRVIRRGTFAAWCFVAPVPVSLWLLISRGDARSRWFWGVLMVIGCIQIALYVRLAMVHQQHGSDGGKK